MYQLKSKQEMKTINFTEFRKQSSYLFSLVEEGEIIEILRHGKPIARIYPQNHEERKEPKWKKPGLKLKTSGKNLSSAILEEREE